MLPSLGNWFLVLFLGQMHAAVICDLTAAAKTAE
jgi:hypothetical protein